jgi:hypothetical protein
MEQLRAVASTEPPPANTTDAEKIAVVEKDVPGAVGAVRKQVKKWLADKWIIARIREVSEYLLHDYTLSGETIKNVMRK